MRAECEGESNRIDLLLSDIRCVILREEFFTSYNGYLGLPESHPFYQVASCDLDTPLKPHGGWTYSGFNDDLGPDLWWIGFDTLHRSDTNAIIDKILSEAGIKSRTKSTRQTPKVVLFVNNELFLLARSLRQESLMPAAQLDSILMRKNHK